MREPEVLRTVTEPPTASSAAGRSACGSAWAREPPIVPRLRTAGEPMPAAAWATARAPRCTSAEVATSRCRVIAPITISSPPAGSRSARRCRRGRRGASGDARRSRIIGTRDWPPAIGFAPSRSGGERLVDRGGPGVARARAGSRSGPRASRCGWCPRCDCGCIGISRWRMPSGDSASTAAFTTAGVAAIVPASPMPFAPSGLTGDGVTVRSSVIDGRSAADGIWYSTSDAVRSCPSLAVHRLLEQGLRDRLDDAAVHLPVDDHRVDDVAAVVDGDVVDDLDATRLGVDLDLAHVRAEREREVRRIVEGRRLHAGLDARRAATPPPRRTCRAPGSSGPTRASP